MELRQTINHKHYRRKRPLPIMGSNKIYDSPAPVPVPFVHDASKLLSTLFSKTLVLVLAFLSCCCALQQPQQNYLLPGHNMDSLRISESTPVDTIVHQLKASDRQNENRRFSYHMTGDILRVDELTGEVRLSKMLDRERQSQFTVIVTLFDDKNDSPLETKRRTVIVDDIDDSWPIFAPHKFSLHDQQQSNTYQVDLNELAPIGSVVINELLVTDADEGQNAEIVFECKAKTSTNAACDTFSVDSRRLGSGRYTVSVRTKQPVDFERVQNYKLTILARGKRPSPLRGTPLEAEAKLNINLINVQDEGPVFVNAPYSLSMQEGLKSGTRLLTIIAQDGDAMPQRDLSIIIVPGPFSEYFKVTKELADEQNKVWYLETNNTLDRESPLISETGNMFSISLVAAELDDNGSPVASEQELINAVRDPTYSRGTLRKENVTVVVLDLPDSSPMFVQASTGRAIKDNSLVLNISESIVTGTSLPNLDLAVHDLDQGVNSRFKLSLMDAQDSEGAGPQASQVFALESEIIYGKAEVVLNVRNASLLDYEDPNLRSYKFNLVASKSSAANLDGPNLVQILEMQVNTLDANDNSPEFDRDQYVLEIAEGKPPGTLVGQIKASDKDSGVFGRVNYTLRGSGAGRFKLVSGEGKILVNDCAPNVQCLDHENQSSYSLTYEARDGGGRTKNVSVLINILDVNDNPPKFTEEIYHSELISDNLSSKQNFISPQLIVRAKDADGPSQGKNNITYRILDSNLTNLDIEPSSGLVYLSQPIDLDSLMAANSDQQVPGDRKIMFEAEVIAEDNGWPVMLNATAKIQLSVKGNSDGAPHFRQDVYQAFVREDQPVNKSFYQVKALDPDDTDSQLRYSLGYDLNDLININPISGELSFKTKVDFDDFSDNLPYNVTVYATDNNRPYPMRASAIVSILIQDVNDKPPKFEQDEYKSTLIQGKTKLGDVVLQVRAQDPDKDAELNYTLLVDRIVMQDRNGQQFSLKDIENPDLGYLAHMSQADRHSMVSNYKKLFEINATTGAVRLTGELDYSFASLVMMPVQVQDIKQEKFTPSGMLQTSQINCTFFLQTHVGKSPIFAPPWSMDKRDYNLSILEELQMGSPIYSLLAKDPMTGERITYFEKLFESDPKDFFRVDRSSGIVTVNRRIDFEEMISSKRLGLSVKAISNDGMYSVANLNIQVVDLNDNSPQFKSSNYSASVSEAIAYPQEIITVAAEDRDSGDFGRVYYSLSGYSSDFFSIDQVKGVITLKKGIRLDRDLEPIHLLLVTASDCNETNAKINSLEIPGCRKSSVFVNVTLIDENDNDPVFITGPGKNKQAADYEALISETATIGSVIAQIRAVDLDEGLNGKVGYEIVRSGSSSNDDFLASRLVKIDQEGYLSVADTLAGMGRSTPYRIIIRAYDKGKSTSRQSQATLLLTISDVVANDGVPKFIRPKPDEIVHLSEQAGPGTFVYQVQAIDSDEKTDGQLMYKFIQQSDVFEIDPFTGVIKTSLRAGFYLDREQKQNYTLVVIASDLGSPRKEAHQVLVIKITDVNDNEPYFERNEDDPPLILYVEEEMSKEHLIGTIQAVDKDVGQNALIGYEIIDGNQNNLFRLSYEQDDQQQEIIGNNPCRIYTNSRLDRESRETYLLTIKASSMSKLRNPFVHQLKDPLGNRNPFNQYNASDLTKLRVMIKLMDINDNRPVFSQQNPKSVVDSSAEVYSQLMVFKANDADSSNPEMQYSILDALFYTDSRLKLGSEVNAFTGNLLPLTATNNQQPMSLKYVFDLDPKTGILRNSISLRPYIDGYFEVYVKADSSSQFGGEQLGYNRIDSPIDQNIGTTTKRSTGAPELRQCQDANAANSSSPFADLENCHIAITKATVFITHQRETFRFVFNKTKLNDRLDEFKTKVQSALEEMMFSENQVQASTDARSAKEQQSARAERVYLNTFNTDFFEREDGSLDFSTLTSCSQLVKFEDSNNNNNNNNRLDDTRQQQQSQLVPNQVIEYEQVLSLLRALNHTQSRQQQQQNQKSSTLFSQYGLVNIERCLPDRALYKMSTYEKLSLYFAAMIALVSLLLAFIVSRMRKSYEKNLKLLQRSKYQYMSHQYPQAPGDMWCNGGF